ncbi:MAG: OmpA family protein, partial [Desulfobacterales bacterium]|nr:OmpA family protein [Desulfobacterales bacterium]
AMDLVSAFSEGFPRLINIICDHALLTAYAGDKKFVSDTIITECARDLQIRPSRRQAGQAGQPEPAPPSGTLAEPEPEKPGSKRRKVLTAAVFVLFFLALAGYGAFLWLPDSAALRNFLPDKLLAGQEADEKPMTKERAEKSPAPRAGPEKSRNMPGTRSNSPDAEPAAEAATHAEKKPPAQAPAQAPEQKNQVRRSIARQNPQTAQNAKKPEGPGNKPQDTAAAKKPEKKTELVRPEAPQAGAEFVRASAEPAPAGAGNARTTAEKPPINPGRKSREKLVVYFLHDAYDLDPHSIETLEQAKQLLIKNPRLKTRVLGYTDSLGDEQYNLRLSEIRADIVKSYLTGNGVEAEQIAAEGLGSQNPMRSNQTREGRAQNRRVEIVFEYPQR